jgi:hypothetical protein
MQFFPYFYQNLMSNRSVFSVILSPATAQSTPVHYLASHEAETDWSKAELCHKAL